MLALILIWQTDMNTIELAGQDMTDEIILVTALHADNVDAVDIVIETRIQGVIPAVKHLVPLGLVGVGHYIVRIVDTDDMRTEARQGAAKRQRPPRAALIVAEHFNCRIAQAEPIPQRS